MQFREIEEGGMDIFFAATAVVAVLGCVSMHIKSMSVAVRL
jgi:hypothetical protein